nr:MAG TPA: hypothetical protein [Caudoviricetes sp.]
MKITKTVGQCPFCDVIDHHNDEEFNLVLNKDRPVVSIYRRIIKDDGSIETLSDFKIYIDGTVNVAPWALLDYNKELGKGTCITYLSLIRNLTAICKDYMNNPDNNRCALLNRLDRIKDHPFQHNIVQIDEEVHVQTDISFIECDNVDGTCDSDNDGFYDINAVTVCWKNNGYKWELQTSEGDGFCHIDGDDRIILGKISLGDDKSSGYILNDGGVIFESNQSLDYDVFNTIIVRSYAIRANFMDIDKIPSMKHFTFNDHIVEEDSAFKHEYEWLKCDTNEKC